jgi:hypothetical protein
MFQKHVYLWDSGPQKTAYTDITWLPNEDYFESYSDKVYAKAYPKFVASVKGVEAEIAVSLAERQEALDMIAKRATQLAKAVREVRSFRWTQAARTLGLKSSPRSPRSPRATAKNFGSAWLEYWLGWAPFIGDIGNAVDVLQGPVPPLLVRESSRHTWSWRETSYPSQGVTDLIDHELTVRWALAAMVKIKNPNLYLANQLGFVNPASVLWAVTPFSFMFDWIVNVGDFLGSFTDFWGVDLVNPYRTRYMTYHRQSEHRTTSIWGPQYNSWKTRKGRVVSVQRWTGYPPGPNLVVRAPWSLSSTRALTSVSLLLQLLRK